MIQPAYSVATIKQAEIDWFNAGNSSFGLMQQAAYAVSLHIWQYKKPKQVLIYCGSGNNGGDGWLAGLYLSQLGAQVFICEVLPPATADATLAKQQVVVGIERFNIQVISLQEAANTFCDVIVDAIFGIGLNRKPSGVIAQAIWQINQKKMDIFALDVPSGLNADTGYIWEDVCVKASYTLCLIALKTGLLTGLAPNVAGQLVVLPLIPLAEYLPQALYHQTPPKLPPRQPSSHKGSHGHVLVVGGCANMGGAVILAAQAAIRAGAGKVTVACHPKHHGVILAQLPEAMTYALPQEITQFNTEEFLNLVEQVDVLAIGMGLGRELWSQQMWQTILPLLPDDLPLVCDADALYWLAKLPLSIKHLQNKTVKYTPHSGEASRLLNVSVAQIEQNRFTAIKQLHQIYAGAWVLKGAGSLVLEENELHICGLGNAGMATAGMGDVLSGILVGLLAQNNQLETIDAVCLHAAAGDLAAKTQGQRGLIASDVIDAITHVVNLV